MFLRRFVKIIAGVIGLAFLCGFLSLVFQGKPGGLSPAPTRTPASRSLVAPVLAPTVTEAPTQAVEVVLPTLTPLPATPTEPAAEIILLPTDTPQPIEPTPKSLGSDIDPLPVITDAPADEPVKSGDAIPVSPDQPVEQAGNCDPSYPDVCIPPVSVAGDLDCKDIPQLARFRVLPPDPHGFDKEGDGIGCENN